MFESRVEDHEIFVDAAVVAAWQRWSWLELLCLAVLGVAVVVALCRRPKAVALREGGFALVLSSFGALLGLVFFPRDPGGAVFVLVPELSEQTARVGATAAIALGGAAGLLVGVVLARLIWGGSRFWLARGAPAVVATCLAAATLVVAWPVRQARQSLARISSLPHFSAETPEMHPGKSREVTVHVTRLGARRRGLLGLGGNVISREPESLEGKGWRRVAMEDTVVARWDGPGWAHPGVVEVTAPEEPGTFPVTVELSRGPIRVRKVFEGRAVAEVAHPGMPLAVGHRWEYEVRRTGRGGLLWGIVPMNNSGPPLADRVVFEVESARVVDGFRQFELVQRRAAAVEGRYWLRAVDGSTEVVGRGGRAVSWTPSADPAEEYRVFDRQCRGIAMPGPEIEIAGPCGCRRTKLNGGNIALAVLTVGLIIPPDDTRVWTLKRSIAAPPGTPRAAAGPIAPRAPPPPCPPVESVCVAGRKSGVGDLDPYRSLLDRVGLTTEVVLRHGSSWLLVRGTVDELRAAGIRVDFEPGPGLCPNETTCQPRSRYLRATREARRAGLNRFVVDDETCRAGTE